MAATRTGAVALALLASAVQRGRFVCEAEPDAITCSHLDRGHGFLLSKQSYRIF